jgi:hypothetical protein
MTSPFFTGPIPAYNNVPPQPLYYQPRVFGISDILRGPTTTVTILASDHDYVIGQLVRFIVPYPWGMRQINEQLAYVISLVSPDTFVVDLDSSQFDPFISSPVHPTPTTPQVLAVGDNNTGVISQTGRVVSATSIPGAFINLSPI